MSLPADVSTADCAAAPPAAGTTIRSSAGAQLRTAFLPTWLRSRLTRLKSFQGCHPVIGSYGYMSLTRRSVIKGAGAAGSLLLAGGIPVWSRAEQSGASTAPSDYLRLSSALLGVEAAALEPAPRPGAASLADTFHALCDEAAPDALTALLEEFGQATAGGAAAPDVARRLLEQEGRPRPDGAGSMARLTMLMWLYGVWYGGMETARMPGSAAVLDPAHRIDMVVSVHAYRNAWIWRFAQTSPAGVAAAPGAWSEPPPSLARFLNGA